MTESRSHSPTPAAEQERASVKRRSRTHSPDAPEEQPDNVAIEADDGNDTDSAVSVPVPSLESLRSSVLEHQTENGRTYHSMSSGKYAFPNDNGEIERLEIQHNLWLLTFSGEPGLRPKLRTANQVLDAGTGPGLWAIDYADAHPEAEVIGVDLSPIQPSLILPNCMFEIDDLEKDWTWSKPFDFIMTRAMTGSFSDWDAYIKKAYNALEPGGYLEFQDLHAPFGCDDGTIAEDSPTYVYWRLSVESSRVLGRPLDLSPMHKERMMKAGFVDIVEQQFKWPVGTWPKNKYYKEVGYWCHANLDYGLEGLMMALLTRGQGWTKEEVMIFCADVRRGLKDPRVHAYIPIYVVYGRKPEGVTVQTPEVAAE